MLLIIHDIIVKKFVVTWLLLISVAYLNAQSVHFKGIVTDSLNKPLPFANIIAQPLDSLEAMNFAISDDKGYFKLGLTKNLEYLIKVSHIGYKSVTFELTLAEQSQKHIIMKQAMNELQEVVIELPVIVKDDTIIFNARKFYSREDRKLKQLLEKLPGVEVLNSGELRVNGKRVTHMLVEGKKFFGGGSKLAVENIPADAIDRIQVIDNYNEIAFLKGLTDADQMAMNIKLKPDKKQFVFGDLEAGKGNRSFYRAHSNSFYYSPKTNLNFIGKLNNTNEINFTFKDYLRFQQGMSSFLRGEGSVLSRSPKKLNQLLGAKDYVKSSQRFAALNVGYSVNSRLDISGYAIISNSNYDSEETSLRSYSSFSEELQSRGKMNDLLGLVSLNFEYAPKVDSQFYFKILAEKTTSSIDNRYFATINEAERSINEDIVSNGISFSQNIEWHKKLSHKHTVSLAAEFAIENGTPNKSWETNQSLLQGLIPIKESDFYRINQQKEIEEKSTKVLGRHYWVLNSSNQIYTTLGSKFTAGHLSTEDGQEMDDGSFHSFSSSNFGVDLARDMNDLFLGVHHKFKIGIFEIKHGAYWHNYRMKLKDQSNTSVSKSVILPDLTVNVKFGNSKRVKINYQLKSAFPEITYFSNRFVLQSYNVISSGNPNLEDERYHSAQLFYSRFSLYRGLLVFGNATYSKKIKGLKSDLHYSNFNQLISYDMISNPEERITVSFGLDKKIKQLKYRFNVLASRFDFLQSKDQELLKRSSEKIALKFSLQTLHRRFPRVEIGLNQVYGSNDHSKFRSFEPFFRLNYSIGKRIEIAMDYKLQNYSNESFDQKIARSIANATLLYKKPDHPFSFKLTLKNMFNSKYVNRNTITPYFVSETKIHTMPSIIMLSMGYDL